MANTKRWRCIALSFFQKEHFNYLNVHRKCKIHLKLTNKKKQPKTHSKSI